MPAKANSSRILSALHRMLRPFVSTFGFVVVAVIMSIFAIGSGAVIAIDKIVSKGEPPSGEVATFTSRHALLVGVASEGSFSNAQASDPPTLTFCPDGDSSWQVMFTFSVTSKDKGIGKSGIRIRSPARLEDVHRVKTGVTSGDVGAPVDGNVSARFDPTIKYDENGTLIEAIVGKNAQVVTAMGETWYVIQFAFKMPSPAYYRANLSDRGFRIAFQPAIGGSDITTTISDGRFRLHFCPGANIDEKSVRPALRYDEEMHGDALEFNATERFDVSGVEFDPQWRSLLNWSRILLPNTLFAALGAVYGIALGWRRRSEAEPTPGTTHSTGEFPGPAVPGPVGAAGAAGSAEPRPQSRTP